jgi:O-antigen/teichoic acid export membrane protein
LVAALVLARVLGADDWNRIAFLLSIHLALVTFAGLGLQHTLLYFIESGQVSTRWVVTRTALLIAAIGAATNSLLWLLSPLIGSALDVASMVVWVAIAATLELPTTCAQPAFVATQRFRSAAVWDTGTTLVLLCGVVIGAKWNGANGVVWCLVISSAIRLAAFCAVLPTFPSGPATRKPRPIRSQLAFALPLGLTLAAGVLTRSIDKWYITAFRPFEVGSYSLAAQEIPLLAVIPYAGSAAVAAQLAGAFRNDNRPEALGIWRSQAESMSRLVVPSSVGLMVLAPVLVPAATDNSNPALIMTFILFTAITLHRVAEYGMVLRAAGRPRDVLGSALVLLSCNAVFAGLGAWRWGSVGAAAGTLAANVVAWLWALTRIANAIGVSLQSVFPWRVWSTALVASAGAAAAAVASSRMVDGPIVVALVQTATFLVVVVTLDQAVVRLPGWRIDRIGAS